MPPCQKWVQENVKPFFVSTKALAALSNSCLYWDTGQLPRGAGIYEIQPVPASYSRKLPGVFIPVA
jgi:hypothetical protein